MTGTIHIGVLIPLIIIIDEILCLKWSNHQPYTLDLSRNFMPNLSKNICGSDALVSKRN